MTKERLFNFIAACTCVVIIMVALVGHHTTTLIDRNCPPSIGRHR